MKYKYEMVSLRSIKGIKKAETLKRNGWKIISGGIDTVQFEKPVSTKKGAWSTSSPKRVKRRTATAKVLKKKSYKRK